MKNTVTIYTDGASRGNPGPGGWAVILMSDTDVVELAGAQKGATNNQMELEAAIKGLTYAAKHFKGENIELHADSTYVLNGLNSWVDGWIRNGWKTVTKKPVENKAQWEQLAELRDSFGRKLSLVKVAGHSGHEYNDRCDELAVAAALGEKVKLFKGTIADYRQQLTDTPPKSVKKTASKSSKGDAYSYVSLVDGKVSVDKTWAACEKRVKGKKAKYKKVFSKAEETDLVQNYTLESLF